MKESYRKGVAIHPDPESCVSSREAAIEALTGAHAGRVLSCEIIATRVPTPFSMAEGSIDGGAIEVAIGGSGDVAFEGGRSSAMDVSIAGSGDVRFAGVAGSLEAAIVGAGDIQVNEVTGNVSRSIMGAGDIRVGR